MLLPTSNWMVGGRFACFLAQVVTMIWMGVMIVLAALGG
jgi:hypothetical protein